MNIRIKQFGLVLVLSVFSALASLLSYDIIPNFGQFDTDIISIIHSANHSKIEIRKNSIIEYVYNSSDSTYASKKIDLTTPLGKENVEFKLDSGVYYNYFIGRDSKNWESSVLKARSIELYKNSANSIKINSNGVNRNNGDKFSSYSIQKDNSNRQELISLLNSFFAQADKPAIKKKNSKLENLKGLEYSTFVGGISYDNIESIKLDSARNLYVCGYTYSSDFPKSNQAFDTINKSAPYGYPSCFVSKFDSAGKLVFSTFLGGYWDDYANDLCIAKDGSVIISGYTASTTTFPSTSGVYDSTGNGGYDAFVARISADGKKLIYSTFLGGKNDDFATGLAIDTNDNPYIVGYTQAGGNFPVSENAYQSANSGKFDAFVAKFNNTAGGLIYSTLLGGMEDDFAQDIAVDTLGKAYICGFTNSSAFPITFDAIDKSYNDTTKIDGEKGDIFISKLNEDGSRLDYSSFWGASKKDGAYAIRVADSGYVYLAAYTESADFPTSEQAFQRQYSSGSAINSKGDIACIKFNNRLDQVLFSTFLGGNSTDRVWSMEIDSKNNPVLVGVTNSTNFPKTKNALDSSYNDDDEIGGDAFISKISADGSKLLYSTYLGASKQEVAKSVALVNDTLLLVGGITTSPDFPVTTTAFDPNYHDQNKSDAFYSLVRIDPYKEELRFDFQIDTNRYKNGIINLCKGDKIACKFKAQNSVGLVSYEITPLTGVTIINGDSIEIAPDISITYYIKASDISGAVYLDSIMTKVYQTPSAFIYGSRAALKNSSCVYYVINSDSIAYEWHCQNGVILSGQGGDSILVKWSDSTNGYISLYAKTPGGCSAYSGELKIFIGENFNIELNYKGSVDLCQGDSIVLSVKKNYYEYKWSNGSTEPNTIVNSPGMYWLIAKDDKGFIGYSDTINVISKPAPTKPSIRNFDGALQCTVIAPKYQWYKDMLPIAGAVQKSYKPSQSGAYQVRIYSQNNCSSISDVFSVSDVEEPNLRDDAIFKIERIGDNLYMIQSDNIIAFNVALINSIGLTTEKIETNTGRLMFSTTGISRGIYYIVVESRIKTEYKSIIIQ
jgi:hypothetical protein